MWNLPAIHALSALKAIVRGCTLTLEIDLTMLIDAICGNGQKAISYHGMWFDFTKGYADTCFYLAAFSQDFAPYEGS